MDPTSLWDRSRDIADACLTHPFVSGIADGTLDSDAFRHYVGQDAAFLDAFARAYALCAAKSPDTTSLRAFAGLLDGVLEELELHREFAGRWDVDLDPEPTAATRAYTDFLLRTASLEPVGHAVAAMAPCMQLYAWLGRQLAPTAHPDSPYIEWVRTYDDAGFHELAATLDRLLADLGGDPDVIARHHRTAMELELAFFDSAHRAGGGG